MKKVGLVGLPNSGKSSLFKLLTKKDTLIANYCFSTMEKEIESFEMFDERIYKISSFFKNPKLTFSNMKITDIPGIVKDAHKNKGLGSKFISHIRECDLMLIVIRFFEDDSIIHFEGKVDPLRDFETLISELILSDLEQVEKALEKSKGEQKEKNFLTKIRNDLNLFKPISEMEWIKSDEKKIIKNYSFLTSKPIVIVANLGKNKLIHQIEERINNFRNKVKNYEIIETDIKENLSKKVFKNQAFFNSLSKSLGTKNFFTAGDKEVKSWTIEVESDAKECAGLIHSDIKNRLIRVSVVNESYCQKFEDIKKNQRKEKKDYLVKDGDLCDFIFN